jgi:hypothetical protein
MGFLLIVSIVALYIVMDSVVSALLGIGRGWKYASDDYCAPRERAAR